MIMQEDEELLETKNNDDLKIGNQSFFSRRKKAIIITSFVLIVIVILLVPTLLYVTRKKINENYYKFDDMFNSSFYPRSSNIRWVNTGTTNSYLYSSGGVLYSTNIDNEQQTVLLNSTLIRETHGISYNGYFMSPDSEYFLLYNNYTKLWRHSFIANYFLYKVADNTLIPLSSNKEGFTNALFSPDSRKVAFVYLNNIFIKNIDTGVETQVTNNGSPDNFGGEIKNGIQSWVYEEEIFSDYNAIWFSPDSQKIAYFLSNETLVPVYTISVYKIPYNQQLNFKYPKSGYPNPSVDFFIFDTNTSENTKVDLSADPLDYLILAVKWRDNNNVYLRKSDRFQTQDIMYKVQVGSSTPNLVSNNTRTHGWYEPDNLQQMFFINSGSNFVDLRENNNYIQLGVFDSENGQLIRWLTNDNSMVTSIIGFIPSHDTIYFQRADTVAERMVYTIKTDGTELKRISGDNGTYSASISVTGDYYILTFSGDGSFTNVPTYSIFTSSNHSLLRVIENNSQLSSLLSHLNLPRRVYFSDVLSADKKYPLNGRITYPPNFDPKKKYITLLYVYGGPGSQNVRKSYSLGFDEYLATQGVIVACVDGRGTGYYNVEFEQSVYLQLGVLETQDQLEAAKYLRNLKYVSKLGVYGWSYGGYMSSRILLDNSSHLFDYGISVAPVTDWRLYDTVYTERFMKSPEANPNGYEISSNLPQAANLKVPLLLVHGTADDNVHFQNSQMLSWEFIKYGIEVDNVYYPNSDHSINLGNSRRHLYHRMTKFIQTIHNSTETEE